ncbi:hypothetical protein ABPG72_020477 [Tetrahymena utriculariae]
MHGEYAATCLAKSLQNLINLTDLKITVSKDCNIGENSCSALAQSIIGKRNLTNLVISIQYNNKIGNKGAVSIGEALGELKQLQFFQIIIQNQNEIYSEGARAIAEGIQQISNLINLDISINYNDQISQKGMASFGSALSQLSNLQALKYDFSQNITNLSAMSFAEGFMSLKQLKQLQLFVQTVKNVSEENIKLFLESLQHLANLDYLYLSFSDSFIENNINLQSLSTSLKFMKNLKVLKLDLHLKGQNYYVFGDILGSLSQIVKLDLNLRVPVSEESVYFEQIAHGIKNLVSIQDLNLSFVSSGLNENSYKLFVDIFERLINLKKLYLLIDQMKSGVLEYIGKSFLHLQNLESLNLNLELLNMSDEFIDKEIIALGNGISHLINLTELLLDLILDVRASNDSINSIAKGIKSLINLEKLYANLNNRSGQVLDILTYIDSFNYLQNAELRIGENSYFKKINQKINLDDQKNSTENEIEEELQLKSKNEPNCLSLKSLDVRNFNQINQDGAYNLSQGIKSLSGLRSIQLYLEGCNIQRQGAILIGGSLSYLTRLKTLQLLIVQDKIQSDGAVAIGRAIKNLYDLNELKIQIGEQNEIKKIGAYEIGVGMQFLTNLTHLRLIIKDNNDIESDGISSICKSISKMIYLKNDVLKYLSRIFPQLPKLKRLQIQIAQPNRYDQIGVIEIYDNIKIVRLLVDLDLQIDRIKINKIGVEAIAQALLSLTNLQILNFRINDGLGLIEGAKDLAFALGQLVELKQLKFSISPQNFINSEIQVEFSNSFRNLKKIESFQIEGLYFLDKQSIISFTDIFNGLSQLKKLSLQIESSKINGQYAVLSLSNSLKNLENLSEFQITINNSCNIGVEGSLALAQAIKFMKKLTKLSIFIDRNNKIGQQSCLVGSQGILYLSQSISTLKQLSDLTIFIDDYNYVRNEGLIYLASIFSQLPNLIKIQIKIGQSNRYDDLGIIDFCENLSLIKQLKHLKLDVDARKISKVGVQAIAKSLEQLTNLESLDFIIDSTLGIEGAKELVTSLENRISSEISIELSNSLKNLHKLQSFQIEGFQNFQDEQTIACFAEIFSLQPQLTNLSLEIDCSKLYGKYTALCLANSLKNLINLTNLKIIVCRDCNIGDQGCSALAQVVKNMKNLKQLLISIDNNNNKIGNKGAFNLGEALGELKQLESLYLNIGYQNEIFLEGARAIAEGIQKMLNLINLDVSISRTNQIKQIEVFSFGQILSQISNLENLKYCFNSNITNLGVQGFAKGFQFQKNQRSFN